MMSRANKLLLSVIAVWISFAFGEGSPVTYHTQEGCNATLVCNQPGNVTWVYTATSQEIEGPRFRTLTHAFFSTLSIIDVSKNDGGNITCLAEEHNSTFNVVVCHDTIDSQQCLSTINSGDHCTSPFMVNSCKKSCGLCPEPNCTEAVLPTMPPTTAQPQTTTEPTTEPGSTMSSSTRNVERDGNYGVSLAAGFHNIFVLASSFFSVIVLVFPNA
ncbi:hypothetical protein ACROYT_G007606 [Oculina patagonica]